MKKVKIITILIFTILYISSLGKAEYIRKIEKIHHLEEGTFISYGEDIAKYDNSFVYLNYTTAISNYWLDKKNQSVVLQKPRDRWDEKKMDTYVCNYNLRALVQNPPLTEERTSYSRSRNLKQSEEPFQILGIPKIKRLTADKIIIWWISTFAHRMSMSTTTSPKTFDNNVTISIINMKECLPVHLNFPANVDFQLKDVKLVTYNDSFDIFTCDKKLCKKPTCKITYDFNGKEKGNPICYGKSEDSEPIYMTPMENNESISGFYAWSSLKNHTGVTLNYFDRNGSKKELITTNDFKRLLDHTKKIHIGALFHCASATNGKYTICQSDDAKIHCVQLEDNRVSLNFTLTFSHATYIRAAVYNLPEGGLVLAIVKCPDFLCYDEVKLLKVNADGELVKTIAAPESTNKFRYVVKSLNLDLLEFDDEICAYSSCIGDDKHFKSRINGKYSAFCVSKSDF